MDSIPYPCPSMRDTRVRWFSDAQYYRWPRTHPLPSTISRTPLPTLRVLHLSCNRNHQLHGLTSPGKDAVARLSPARLLYLQTIRQAKDGKIVVSRTSIKLLAH